MDSRQVDYVRYGQERNNDTKPENTMSSALKLKSLTVLPRDRLILFM